MKRIYPIITAVFLLLVASAPAYAKSTPPVGQTVIREGDYAVELAKALKLGAQDEAGAEKALAERGIAPDSGWISDFPVTPDIVAQVNTAVEAADLPIGKEESGKALLALNEQLGLAITPGAGEYDNKVEPSPGDLEGYYEEGPPIITYYPPPPEYVYLYAWDPFPFWWGGCWFPGYFVLFDFDFVFDGHHHHHHHRWSGDRDGLWYYRNHDRFRSGHREVTNHLTDPVSKKTVTVDPVSKRPFGQTAFRPVGARSFDPVERAGVTRNLRTTGNASGRGWSRGGSFDRKSATEIWNRSVGRSRDTGVRGRGAGGPSSMRSRGIDAWRGFGYSRDRGTGGPSGGPGRSFNAPSAGGPGGGGSRGGGSLGSGGGGSRGGGGGGSSGWSGGSSGGSIGGGFGGRR